MVPSALRAAPGDCAPEYVFETAEFRLVQCVHHEAADTALKVKPARARWVKANHLMPAPGMKSGLPVPFVKILGVPHGNHTSSPRSVRAAADSAKLDFRDVSEQCRVNPS